MLLDAQLLQQIRALREVQLEVRHCRDWVKTLGIGLGALPINERDVLRTVDALKLQHRALAARLGAIGGALPSLTRQVGRTNTSNAGRVGHLRGTVRLVTRDLENLRSELEAIGSRVTRLMNDPGRHGDASMAGPVGVVVGVVNTLLELLADALSERK